MEQNARLKRFAQENRRNPAKEALLWYRFLSRYPVRFRRQYIIGNYIADFYCHKAKLVVELDGSQHYDPTQMKKDAERSAYLESLGLCVLRYTNLDVQQRFHAVCETINRTVQERTGCTMG